MKKITEQACKAFLWGESKKFGHTEVECHYSDENGHEKTLFFHESPICKVLGDELTIYHFGWQTVTTKERINGLLDTFRLPHRVFQKNFEWYIWDGEKNVPFDKAYTIKL